MNLSEIVYRIVGAEVPSVGKPEPAIVHLGPVALRRHIEVFRGALLRSYLEPLSHFAISDLHVLTNLKWENIAWDFARD